MTEQRLRNPDYIFVWDKKEQRVVASYYVAKERARVPDDTTRGEVLKEDRMDLYDLIKEEFPPKRYEAGGGTAESLAECVKHNFGWMAKDYDDLVGKA